MRSLGSAYLSVERHVSLPVLVARWHRSVMPFELHAGYAAMLDVAVACRCRFWLIDIQQRAALTGNDAQWLLEQFFPQLQPRLGHSTFLAYLMAPHQLAGLLADIGVPDEAYFAERPYRLQRFTAEAEALAWLQHCRRDEAAERRRMARSSAAQARLKN